MDDRIVYWKLFWKTRELNMKQQGLIFQFQPHIQSKLVDLLVKFEESDPGQVNINR